jgi:casein kinase II subunit beta
MRGMRINLLNLRYIITTRGLDKMLQKYKKAEFGRCPRVLCGNQPLLPVGLSDLPFMKGCKLYCGKCEDVYNPRSSRHQALDGAFFGTSFPHMFFQSYPTLFPQKTSERYIPRIFGFKIRDYTRVLTTPNESLFLPSQQKYLAALQESENGQIDLEAVQP